MHDNGSYLTNSPSMNVAAAKTWLIFAHNVLEVCTNQQNYMYSLALPCIFTPRAYGTRPASVEFPDGSRHSFAAAYGRRAQRELAGSSGAR